MLKRWVAQAPASAAALVHHRPVRRDAFQVPIGTDCKLDGGGRVLKSLKVRYLGVRCFVGVNWNGAGTLRWQPSTSQRRCSPLPVCPSADLTDEKIRGAKTAAPLEDRHPSAPSSSIGERPQDTLPYLGT
ncbi:hypothetical protein CSAL01_02166 [Colletotrichum salicis]|uniref:Uncharacterized protein n=1 Tax=Colletotrichum salicis TaxID=1209931 RepID=A0A135UUC3_9PEZI|nr:hypothetical protein CSAL01_02166 [Colletotrichum salicis]